MVLVIILTACTGKMDGDATSMLDLADSLCETHPGRALIFLDSIRENGIVQSECALRRWQLLRTKAQYRSDIPLTTDSVMRQVVDYFEHHGTPAECVEAYYYLSACHIDMHDYPRGIVWGRKTVDLSEKMENPKPEIMAKTCSMLSYVFRRQHNFPKALEYAQKGCDTARKFGFLDPIYVMDVATCYFYLNDMTNTTRLYKEVLEKIQETHTERQHAALLCEMLGFFPDMERWNDADVCYQLLRDLPESVRPVNYNSSMTRYFIHNGKRDSAIVYSLKELGTNDPYRKRTAAHALMNIFHEEENYKKACHYAQIYAKENTIISKQLQLEQTRDANNEYQYRRDIEAEAKIYRQAEKAHERMLLTIALCGSALLLSTLMFFAYKWKMTTDLLQQREEKERLDLLYKELKQVTLRTEADAKHSPVIERFRQAGINQQRMDNDSDWMDLFAAMQVLYPEFTQVLFEQKVKVRDMRIACLARMGMSVQEIQTIAGVSRATVNRKKRELRNVMGNLLQP